MSQVESRSTDRQVEAAMAANMKERNNKPRVFIYLALVVFVGASIYTLTSYRKLRASSTQLRQVARQTRDYDRLMQQIDMMNESNSGVVADDGIKQELEAAAEDADLDVAIREESEAVGANRLRTKRFTATLDQVEPYAVLSWLDAVLNDPTGPSGMEVNHMKFTRANTRTSEQGGWDVNVQFIRKEAVQ